MGVKLCMAKLRGWSEQPPHSGVGISVELLSAANPDMLEALFEGVHWQKSKCRKIVAAAQDVKTRWNGKVPTKRSELVTLPGIGPKLADLLDFLFGALRWRCATSSSSQPPSRGNDNATSL